MLKLFPFQNIIWGTWLYRLFILHFYNIMSDFLVVLRYTLTPRQLLWIKKILRLKEIKKRRFKKVARKGICAVILSLPKNDENQSWLVTTIRAQFSYKLQSRFLTLTFKVHSKYIECIVLLHMIKRLSAVTLHFWSLAFLN